MPMDLLAQGFSIGVIKLPEVRASVSVLLPQEVCMAKIDAFFNLMFEQKASDLHVSSGNPPILPIPGLGDRCQGFAQAAVVRWLARAGCQ